MNKHTPGPWVIEYQEGNPYITADHGKSWNNPLVCNLYEDVTPSDSVTMGAWLKLNENAEANARLIASSPDLLYALQEIVNAADGDGWNQLDAGLKKARAAIAKATGENK